MGVIFVIGIFGLFMVIAWRTFIADGDDPESDNPDSLFGERTRGNPEASDRG